MDHLMSINWSTELESLELAPQNRPASQVGVISGGQAADIPWIQCLPWTVVSVISHLCTF